MKGNVLFLILNLSLSTGLFSLLNSSPSWAHCGPRVQASATEKTLPGHPTNGPHRVCSRATTHVPCSPTVRGLSAALDLAPAPVGGGRLCFLCLPPPPPCGSHSRGQVSLADAPVSSEPDLSALKITVCLAPSPDFNVGHRQHGGVEITGNSCGKRQKPKGTGTAVPSKASQDNGGPVTSRALTRCRANDADNYIKSRANRLFFDDQLWD